MKGLIPIPSGTRDKHRQVQRMIALLSASRVTDDGIVGANTRRAYSRLTPEQRSGVDDFVMRSGLPPVVQVPDPIPKLDGDVPFKDLVLAEALDAEVDPNYAMRIMMKESNGNPRARSGSGARGLFQLTDIAVLDVYQNYPRHPRVAREDQYDVAWNIKTGVRYLRICTRYAGLSRSSRLKMSEEDGVKVYAVYNLGIGSYRDLVARRFDSKRLSDALATQARVLQSGGPKSYLDNVRTFLYS